MATKPTVCACGLPLTDATREPHTLNVCYAAVLAQRDEAIETMQEAQYLRAETQARLQQQRDQAIAERDAALGTLADARAVLASVVQWRTDLERLGLYGDQRGDQHLVSLAAATVVALLKAVEVPSPPAGARGARRRGAC